MRGVFAHRKGEVLQDELAVAAFWRKLGLEVERLEEENDRQSRLPDLLLSLDGAPFAYCEVKTMQKSSVSIRILHDDGTAEERNEWTTRTVEERLASDLTTAIQQLNYGNRDRRLPNFAVLVNRDPEASPATLHALFQRPLPKSPRSLKLKREAWIVDAIQDFRRNVEFCLWMEPDVAGSLVLTAYFVRDPELIAKLRGTSQLDLDKLVSLECAA
jgi:hypothetical protein